MEEIKHPTYGTLDQLLIEISDSIKRGEFPRIGHDGALVWFVVKYAAQPRNAGNGANVAPNSDTQARA